MIRRFDFGRDNHSDCYCDMDECKDGDYVYYDDYKELSDKYEKLISRLEDLPFDIDEFLGES